MDLSQTALFAAASSVGLFWSQLKNFISKFTAFLVVRIELSGDSEEAFMAYLWRHFRCSRVGDRKFTGYGIFIKPKNRQGKVAFELTGKSVTFFDRWKPIFIGNGLNDQGNGSGAIKISFIRGMFDVEDLLVKAMREYDEMHHGVSNNKDRYYVKKVFGHSHNKNSNDRAALKGEQPHSHDDEGTGHLSTRPLGWEREHLGHPSSETPFSNLAYDANIEEFKTEVIRWKESEKWFKDRGLPWRFGALLSGVPGSGKTSLVRALGQKLDMPIHIYDLTTMDNEELVEFWDNSLASAPCIVLFEDIDRIFDKDKNIRTSGDKSPLTLDCLLNCINGVQSADGILTLITANDVDKVDPALGIPDKTGKSTRPGRLDRAVYFGTLSRDGRYQIAKRILAGFEHVVEETVEAGEGETGAQFESRCAKLALDLYWNKDIMVENTPIVEIYTKTGNGE